MSSSFGAKPRRLFLNGRAVGGLLLKPAVDWMARAGVAAVRAYVVAMLQLSIE